MTASVSVSGQQRCGIPARLLDIAGRLDMQCGSVHIGADDLSAVAR